MVWVLFLCFSCTVPNPGYNQGGGEAGAGGGDLGLIQPIDGSLVPLVDGQGPPPQPDKGLSKPDKSKPTTPSSSFGKICTKQSQCASGEICVFTDESTQKGICLRKCTTLNKPCSVPDPKYFSGCSLYWNDKVGKIRVCVIFCKSPTKSWPCPDTTSYRCKVFDNGLGMCAPKL
jgi:hypothetical protein